MKRDDCLVEILTEELPPKSLLKLANSFAQQIKERLQKAELAFEDIHAFATPRRLAVLIKGLVAAQPDQEVERKGPALSAAFDKDGNPTQACLGFARSCGITPKELLTLKSPQGEWVGYKQHVVGKHIKELFPTIVEQSLLALPIAKRMRWGNNDVEFVRPVLSVILLYGDQIMDATILGCQAGRVTRGHRFESPDWITIPHAAAYETLLETEGRVTADFNKRRDEIKKLAAACVTKALKKTAKPLLNDELVDEVTALVEWPVALCGQFDAAFLDVPKEVLISAMQDHQRYFPVLNNKNELLPNFVTISNIQSQDPARVIHGNERVLRARLSDAAFFYHEDKKQCLDARIERLKGIVYQAKLGTLYDKTLRISQLASMIASKIGGDAKAAERAGMLAKADLLTAMVGEFPELQGVMGKYYAEQDGEKQDIANALSDYYIPRYAGEPLPIKNPTTMALALADRLDTLVGAFGIHQIPTGDKDPYGLRRAAIGVLRYLIENEINLDLRELLTLALKQYTISLENKDTVTQTLAFITERLRAWYQEKGINPDVFAAVAALELSNLLDIDKRIYAVQAFKKLNEAEALSAANKRVSNILKTAEVGDGIIDEKLFEHEAEKVLAAQLKEKNKTITTMLETRNYQSGLLALADLRQPVDNFFDNVMVMTEDKPRRENRVRLLAELRKLFLKVADIALLQ
jgi:glycyl-tRNA synthetase beta chain